MTKTKLTEFRELGGVTPNPESGKMDILIISPGQGSSGYYTAEVLKNAAPLYAEGTHMYVNHEDPAYRSIRDLAGVLVSGGRYEESGTKGPGIYAEAQVFADARETLTDKWPYIGISHQAYGESEDGNVDGHRTNIITKITGVESVDFVTHAGRGGAILGMIESQNKTDTIMTDNKLAEADSAKKLAEAESKVATLAAENAELKKTVAKMKCGALVAEQVGKTNIPVAARARVQEAAIGMLELPAYGNFDEAGYALKVKAFVESESAFYENLLKPQVTTTSGYAVTGAIHGISNPGPGTAVATEALKKEHDDLMKEVAGGK